MRHEHHLQDEFFPRFRRAFLLRSTLIYLVLWFALFFVGGRSDARLGTTIFAVSLPLLVITLSLTIAYRRQVRSFRTYRVVWSPEGLVREQQGYDPVEIPAAAISRIREVPGRGLTVFGTGRQNQISAPSSLSDYEVLRVRLEEVRPIEVKKAHLLTTLSTPLAALASGAAYATVLASESKWLVVGLGIPLVLLLVASMVQIRNSPHLERWLRRLAWLVLLPSIGLLQRIWTVLQG